PRAWFAATHPGGVGAPPGVTTDPCREPADAQVRGGNTVSLRESAARRRKENAAVERREARASRQRRAAPRKARSSVERLAALRLPRPWRGETERPRQSGETTGAPAPAQQQGR